MHILMTCVGLNLTSTTLCRIRDSYFWNVYKEKGMVISLDWTSIFELYVVRCGSKNGHPKDKWSKRLNYVLTNCTLF